MSEMKSGEVRRFFDLLGSIFCGIVVGFVVGRVISTPNLVVTFIAFPVSIAICIYIFSVFPRFYWHFVGTKFLYGYFNFVLISLSNVSLIIFAAVLLPKTIRIATPGDNPLPLYFILTIPMAFFWILGIITAWKFSKRETLLK